MIKVKVCGLRDPGNTREVCDAEPDYCGFIFYRSSPRFIGESAAELFEKVPASILKVGVFVNEGKESVIGIARRWHLDLVQLHGSETPDYCSSIRSEGFKVIKSFGVDARFDFKNTLHFSEACDYFLFDTRSREHGGTGVKYNWKKLSEYSLEKPFFLSGGIGPGDVHLIRKIDNKNLYGVDINSRFETAPGIKNIETVRSFIKELKNNVT